MHFVLYRIVGLVVVGILRALFPKDSGAAKTKGTGHVWRSSGDDRPRTGSMSGSNGGGDRTAKSKDEKSKTDALYR